MSELIKIKYIEGIYDDDFDDETEPRIIFKHAWINPNHIVSIEPLESTGYRYPNPTHNECGELLNHLIIMVSPVTCMLTHLNGYCVQMTMDEIQEMLKGDTLWVK